MDLSNSLRSKSKRIEVLNDFISKHMPPREKYSSNLGNKTFSKDYEKQVRKSKDSYGAGYIGTLSEFYIWLCIGRYVDKRCGIVAEVSKLVLSLERDGRYVLFCTYRDSGEKIRECLDSIRRYVSREEVEDETVIQALHILHKHGTVPFDVLKTMYFGRTEEIEAKDARTYISIFHEPLPDNTVAEIKKIGDLFIKSFTSAGLLKKDSEVVVRPKFGDWSRIVGAEGDIYIDGILYDIKSRSEEGFRKEELEQVYGYYVFHTLDQNFNVVQYNKFASDEISNLCEKDVNGIGIYLSRYGEIIKCDLEPDYCLTKADLIDFAQTLIDQKIRYLENEGMPPEEIETQFCFSLQNRIMFKNIKLDYKKYKCCSLHQYIGCAQPTKLPLSSDISDKKPIMWEGNIPELVIKNGLYYYVHFRASFTIKPAEEPFVHAIEVFTRQEHINMLNSDVYDSKMDAMAEIIMSKDDFELFQKKYRIKKIVYLDGCYFE